MLNPLRGKLHRDSPLVHCRDETDGSRAEDHAGEKNARVYERSGRASTPIIANFITLYCGWENASEQPGAHGNGAWHLRNAKTFAKLIQIARPAGRLLVVFGSGLLLAPPFRANRPGFQLIELDDYLQ